MDKNIQEYLQKINKTKKNKSFLLSFFNKLLICFILVLVCLIIMKNNIEFKNYVEKNIFHDNISFAYLNNLYNRYFGKILPSYKIEETTPVFKENLEYKEYHKYYNGYQLVVSNSYLVPAIESGIIVFNGNIENYGNVLIVEGIDGVDTWYGNIKNINVNLYDYIDKGSFLGETNGNTLYLVFEKNQEYLKFEDYIKN